jgi:hypothetical protein
MFPRICLSFAVALILAAPLAATADSLLPSSGPVPLPQDPAAIAEQSYDRPGMSDAQTSALVSMQMLGAAAACEQVNEARVSRGPQLPAKPDGAADNRADLDAAQQHFLDPAAIAGLPSKRGFADCDRLAGSFDQLQELGMRNQRLQADVDEADGLKPEDSQQRPK